MNHFDYVDDEVANWRQGFHFAPATNFASLSTGKKKQTDRQRHLYLLAELMKFTIFGWLLRDNWSLQEKENKNPTMRNCSCFFLFPFNGSFLLSFRFFVCPLEIVSNQQHFKGRVFIHFSFRFQSDLYAGGHGVHNISKLLCLLQLLF